ncbi:hypothetical protein K9M06_04190 [Candidatus Bipolaricaulota bacterium]|nr:hypothetical protein [Candidatus Bipolaricaulota bacterium]
MYKEINKPIKVGVKFSSGKVEPVWFFWRERKHEIDEVNLYHRSFRGEAPLHHFSVTAGSDVFQLTFDGKNLKWKLDKLWVKGRQPR